MLEDLRVLIQPGAVIATMLVLLLMAAGDVAIIVADRGSPL
jgi:hypothetical protein